MAHNHTSVSVPEPPGAWSPVRRMAKSFLAPVERFLAIEASSGILLLLVALIALVWANSPWTSLYQSIWHTEVGFHLGAFSVEKDLHFVINDGLMTIFFFVVGLEIRREIHCGELSELKRAALPLAAAIGGMIVPAVIFGALNAGRASAAGWGIPMATDIAFALGALALLGKRVAPALRILLLALAVIDDVGAILVIGLFYSSGFKLWGLLVALGGISLILVLQKLGVRPPWAYIAPSIVVWAGAYEGGVHPTLAGVIVGLMTPVRAWFGPGLFADQAEVAAESVRKGVEDERVLLAQLEEVKQASREAVSPVERLQHKLHGWVAYGIMPLFAFANAGVPLGNTSLEGASYYALLGIIGGLVLGKFIGILSFSWLATKAKLALLPRGVRWSHVAVVGIVGGIGFTMSLFVSSLAFPEGGALLETSKLAILCGSGASAVLTILFGRILLPAQLPKDAATSASEAEASTEA